MLKEQILPSGSEIAGTDIVWTLEEDGKYRIPKMILQVECRRQEGKREA